MSQFRWMNGQSRLDAVIIGLLITGVVVSILLEIIGIALFCHGHGRLTISTEATVFIQGHNLDLLMRHLLAMGKEQGIDVLFMTLGIIVLIVTPYLRVIISMIYFAVKRDTKFFIITLFVFAVLLLSLLMH